MEHQTYMIKGVDLEERQIFRWTYKGNVFRTIQEADSCITRKGPSREEMTCRVYIANGKLYYATDCSRVTFHGMSATPEQLDQDDETRIDPTDHFAS